MKVIALRAVCSACALINVRKSVVNRPQHFRSGKIQIFIASEPHRRADGVGVAPSVTLPVLLSPQHLSTSLFLCLHAARVFFSRFQEVITSPVCSEVWFFGGGGSPLREKSNGQITPGLPFELPGPIKIMTNWHSVNVGGGGSLVPLWGPSWCPTYLEKFSLLLGSCLSWHFSVVCMRVCLSVLLVWLEIYKYAPVCLVRLAPVTGSSKPRPQAESNAWLRQFLSFLSRITGAGRLEHSMHGRAWHCLCVQGGVSRSVRACVYVVCVCGSHVG